MKFFAHISQHSNIPLNSYSSVILQPAIVLLALSTTYTSYCTVMIMMIISSYSTCTACLTSRVTYVQSGLRQLCLDKAQLQTVCGSLTCAVDSVMTLWTIVEITDHRIVIHVPTAVTLLSFVKVDVPHEYFL